MHNISEMMHHQILSMQDNTPWASTQDNCHAFIVHNDNTLETQRRENKLCTNVSTQQPQR